MHSHPADSGEPATQDTHAHHSMKQSAQPAVGHHARLWLTRTVLFVSGLFAVLLAVLFARTGSQLALALAADSLLDTFTAGVFVVAVWVAAHPSDDNHPFGHRRAEPIGALVAAVVAGVLAIEVWRSAAVALLTGAVVHFETSLVMAFAVKGIFKGVVAAVALGQNRALKRDSQAVASPALQALAVDARNDMLLSALAVVGYGAARMGWPAVDAYLAFPIGLYVAWAGWDLARDNVRLLMGEAPSPQRQAELTALACAVSGVRDAHDLRAQHLGPELGVHVHVVVDPDITVLAAHDIGEAVRVRLEAEPDVVSCAVHIDIE